MFRQAGVPLDIHQVFMNVDITREGDMIDEIIEGLTIQASETADNNFVQDIAEQLFDELNPNSKTGLDLVALNIQRGRDHGLPGYTAYLERLGRRKPKSFDDLRSGIDDFSVKKLEKVYKQVDDIDLFVGKFAK